ncbi:MAG TPA: beta-ribofuranosylaminobenzene 5'-phosphate synthase family protein [Thermodesulfobacteriota bacterium]
MSRPGSRTPARRSAAPAPAVTVSAPARLHLGLLDLDGGFGRRFGGLGVAIDGPRTDVVVVAEGRDDVTDVAPALAARLGEPGTEEVSGQLAEIVIRHRLAGLPAPRAARVRLLDAPVPHTGFGSGTQLALAVGTALAHAAGFPLDATVVARALRRGLRSGIGVGVFASGGLVVDGGQPVAPSEAEPAAGPLVLARYAVPDAWRFVVVVPRDGRGGRPAPSRPERDQGPRVERVAEICRRLLMEALPAVVVGDLATFGRSLMVVQRLAAEEVELPPVTAGVLAALVDAGVACAGRSAFGPACYALVASQAEADAVAGRVARWLETHDAGAELFVSAPDNDGARVAASRGPVRSLRRP